MNIISRITKDTGLGALSIIIIGVAGVVLFGTFEITKWFLRNLGRMTLFLLNYNEHRPDMPRSF